MISMASFASGQSNPEDISKIRQQIAQIRRATNWNDPASAKKANEEILTLSKQIIMAGNSQGNSNPNQQQGDFESKDAGKDSQMTQEMLNQKAKIFEQIWKSAAGGEGGDVLLAEPLREEIVEKYKNDEKRFLNPALTDDLKTLVLDMTMPGIQTIIDEMESYKSISALIISGGENGVPVDLSIIFKKAKSYPLTELYILNFKTFVTSLPENILQFRDLKILDIYGNNFNLLPSEISELTGIKVLYLDDNPIKTVFPLISRFKNLETLGLYKTMITKDEVSNIREIYPACKITTQ